MNAIRANLTVVIQTEFAFVFMVTKITVVFCVDGVVGSDIGHIHI